MYYIYTLMCVCIYNIYILMYLSNYISKNNYSQGNFYAERYTYFTFWKLFTWSDCFIACVGCHAQKGLLHSKIKQNKTESPVLF